MKKNYILPQIEINALTASDVLTNSPVELPVDPFDFTISGTF